MSRATGRHTRPKKLSAKQNLQIFREEQVELIDHDALRANIDTGVEKNEESEYHLQQAIKASQAAAADAKIKDAFIPTPPTLASKANYDHLYAKSYHHPATYIRSSSTVEDCVGTSYCMDEDDDPAFIEINSSLPSDLSPCTEDQFEEVMSFFEDAAQARQPFAAVDSPPVLPLAELEEQYDDTVPTYVRTYAKFIYDHWHERRTQTGNRGILPRLKFETGADSDDADPYVCFRRRELRQIRKTRNRDAQSAEKLRNLRIQLEQARTLLQLVSQREVCRKQQLQTDRLVFEQRLEAKRKKRELGIKGDDEDFINQKPSAKRTHLTPGGTPFAHQFRLPMGRGGAGDDLRTLEDHQAQKDLQIQKDIQTNIEKHIRWNEGWEDKTTVPLTLAPVTSLPDRSADFRQAMPGIEYLPTPPASVSDEENVDTEMRDVVKPPPRHPTPPIRYVSPANEDFGNAMPAFRLRIGRGGRRILDRRASRRHGEERLTSNSKFEYDDSDEDNLSVDEDNSADDEPLFRSITYNLHLLQRTRDAEAEAVRRARAEANDTSHLPAANA